VPQRKRKRRRLGDSAVPAQRLRAERPNHVWALDFQFDTTVDGRTLKLLHVVDEHTREALAIRVARSIDADHAVKVLDRIVRERGSRPELVRMDNGPEMTANALRDWCRFGGSGRSYIEPGSPWQNPALTNALKHGEGARAEVLVRYLPGALEIDVRDILSAIRVPTLVLHRTGDRRIAVSA